MSLPIPDHYIRSFSKNWDHEVQQQIAKLRDRVTVDSFEGKEKVYSNLDTVEFTERTGRLTDSNPQEITGYKRKMTKRDFKCQIILDRKDQEYLGMLGQPDSEIMEAMRFAWHRAVDAKIIGAASATVYGGADPYVTAIDLTSANRVAVDYVYSGSTANSGLTPQKLQQAARIFEGNEVYPTEEELFLVIGPRQKQDLIQYVQSGTNDVWAKMLANWMESGGKLFGFNVIESNRLTLTTATDVRTCIAFSKRGIFTAPDKMTIKVDELPEKDHAIQISAYADYGFMRRYEKRVVEIYCDESP